MSAIYRAVRAYLLKLIKQENIGLNHKLPSERQLLEGFQASRITIREALFRLESEGLIYRRNRKGWFVAPPRFIIEPTRKADFNLMAREQSRVPATRVLKQRKIRAKAEIRDQLGLPDKSTIFEIIRVRSLDERPIMIEKIYLCTRRFEGIQQYDLTQSITTLQTDHFSLDSCFEACRIKVETLGDDYAEPLEVNPAMPGLCVKRQRLDNHHQPVDYNIEHWLHNAVELQVNAV